MTIKLFLSDRQAVKNDTEKKARLRVARFDEDIPGIWKLCAASFDEFRGCSYDDFYEVCLYRWKNNPSRTLDHVFGWVLETQDNRIVGFLGLLPMKFKIGNNDLTAASGTTWAVDPSSRAHSFDLYREFMAWGGRNFLLDTTAAPIVAKLHASLKMGMHKIPVEHYNKKLLWILKSEPVVRSKIKALAGRNKLWKIAGTFPFIKICSFLFDVRFYKHKRVHFKYPRLAISPVNNFTDEFSQFWDDHKKDYGVTVVRDKGFLNWRHFNTPKIIGESFVFACRDDGGKLLGYIAIQKSGYMNREAGHFVLSDIFYKLERKDVLYALLNHAFNFAKKSNAALFEVYGFHPLVMDALMPQNPRVVNLSRCTYWFKAPSQEILTLCKNGTWWPSRTDGDINI